MQRLGFLGYRITACVRFCRDDSDFMAALNQIARKVSHEMAG